MKQCPDLGQLEESWVKPTDSTALPANNFYFVTQPNLWNKA